MFHGVTPSLRLEGRGSLPGWHLGPLTAHEWWRLISAALIYHHWPLLALIVKGENFYDASFLNANFIFSVREREARLLLANRTTEADALRQDVWWTHSNEGETSGWRPSSASSNKTPALSTTHLNNQEKPARRQEAGANSKGRRCSFQLPDRCRHLKGSILYAMAWKGKVFEVILHSTYLKF